MPMRLIRSLTSLGSGLCPILGSISAGVLLSLAFVAG